jgi:predicted dehydrogenase
VQAGLAVAAAAAGRHLLLDKPLALSLEAADRVVEAVADAQVASLIFFTLRFLPEVAAWMQRVEGAGDWHGGDGAWLGTALEPGSPFADSPWRQRKGALWDLGPHMLALAVPTLGPVGRVTAATGLGDTVHLVLGHEGGASSVLTLSQTVPAAAEGRSFQLYGPQGRSAVPPFELAHRVALDEAIGQLTAMVAAGATVHPCDVRLGRDTVAVLEAAERSLAAGEDTGRAGVVS